MDEGKCCRCGSIGWLWEWADGVWCPRCMAAEIVRLRAIVENVAALDCADGYSMSDNEWIKFWCVLQDAREAVEAAKENDDG